MHDERGDTVAQKNLLEDQFTFRLGRESTHGTAATTMKRLALAGRQHPFGDSAKQMLQSRDTGFYRHDANPMVQGISMDSPVKATAHIKSIPSQLNASATPAAPSSASALSHTILFDHWLGGTSVAAGSTVASSPAPAVGGCTVAAGHGARFAAGQVVLINGEPRVITAVATDAITWSPDLAAAPASGDAVLNTFSHYRAEAQTTGLTVDGAYSETPVETQFRARGVVGQCAWSAEMAQLGTIAFDGMASSLDPVGDLSVPTTEAADDMGAPIRWDGVVYLFPAATTTAPAHVCVTATKIVVPNKWERIRCGAAENTVAAVVATGGREDPPTVEMTLRVDPDFFAGFEANTDYRAIVYTSQGTGTARRLVGWHFPKLRMANRPKHSGSNGLVYMTLSFVALRSGITSGTDLARSPAVLFLG